jgi:hypothetical protein
MLRATETLPAFAVPMLVGLALTTTQCWGEPFTATPPIGGAGGVGGNLADATVLTASTSSGTISTAIATATGAGGIGTNGLVADSTTGGAGDSSVRPSPFGDNCQELRLPAAADTFIYGMFPEQSNDFIGIGNDRLEVSQYGASSKRTLLQFKVFLNTAEAWTIAAAYLELQVIEADSYGGTLNLHRILPRNWEERVASWNIFTSGMPWTTPGADFEPEPFVAIPVTPDMIGMKAVWDVTAEVQALHAGREGYGWVLREANDAVDAQGFNYAFAGRDTVREDEEGPILSIHFCQ